MLKLYWYDNGGNSSYDWMVDRYGNVLKYSFSCIIVNYMGKKQFLKTVLTLSMNIISLTKIKSLLWRQNIAQWLHVMLMSNLVSWFGPSVEIGLNHRSYAGLWLLVFVLRGFKSRNRLPDVYVFIYMNCMSLGLYCLYMEGMHVG